VSSLSDLLEQEAVYEVMEYDHPDFAWYVSIDDEVAAEYDDLVEALTRDLARLPGVRAVREDREVVLVSGGLNRPQLENWLADWWRQAVALNQ
jgi:hypothetical protein